MKEMHFIRCYTNITMIREIIHVSHCLIAQYRLRKYSSVLIIYAYSVIIIHPEAPFPPV